ncbi:MAG: tetratricopeptide repeat protein [bacterium]
MKQFKLKKHRRFNFLGIILMMVLGVLVLDVSHLYPGGGPNVNGAKLYIQQNDLDKALSVLLKEINERNPNNEDAWYLLGYVYARQKNYAKMMEAFNKAVELKPKFKDKGIKINKDTGPQFHSQFGTEMILRIIWGNAFNAAVKYFNDGVNAADDSTRINDFEKSIENFKTASIIMPDSLLAFRNMAAAMLNIGRYEESIEPLQQALAHKPDDVEVRTMLAQVYMTSEKDSLALPILEQLWAEGNHTVEVAENLSGAYMRLGNTEKAKSLYKEALETNPNNFNFLYNYGTLLLQADEFEPAIELFEKAYAIDNQAADINYNLGAAYLNRGVAKKEALPEDSEDTSYKEDFKLALPYLEKAIKMNPTDEHIWFTLGQIAGQLNKISLAGYAFSKGDPTKSALDKKVIVGMPSSSLKAILGEPDVINPLESEQFPGVEEWLYKKRAASKGKIAIPDQLNIYVENERVEALMVLK